jgi:hypothetical protein
LAVRGNPLDCSTSGGYRPQPEQILSDFLNDPHQFADLGRFWNGLDPNLVAGNEVAQWYPCAVQKVFGAPCSFVGAMTVEEAAKHLEAGHSIQICLASPGHFLAIVAWDQDKKEFVINDPWAGRWPDGTGWNKRLSVTEFEHNTKPVAVVYA